jgi:hypothetical protein
MTDNKQLPLFEQECSVMQPAESVDTCDSSTASSPESDFSKYIVYVDESGDHGMDTIDPQYPIFVLAFCVFHKRHYSEQVVSALEKFKFNYFGHDQVVLHENEIRKEKGQFNIFRSREQKIQFLNELTEIIDHSNFILISCVIDKQRLRKPDIAGTNPYHIALGYCLESLYEFLREKQQHMLKTHVVVECRGKREDIELELEFRRICDGNNSQGISFPFEVLFSDKKAMSSGLQLADLVARPIGLSLLRPNQHNKAFDVLKSKFYCDGGRECVGRGYEDLGLVIYPPLESEKPR